MAMASAQWTETELAVLQRALVSFPKDESGRIAFFIRLAAELPARSVRSVAHMVVELQKQRMRMPAPTPVRSAGQPQRFFDSSSFAMSALPLSPQNPGVLVSPGPSADSDEGAPEPPPDVKTLLEANQKLLANIEANSKRGLQSANVALAAEFKTNTAKLMDWCSKADQGALPPIPVTLSGGWSAPGGAHVYTPGMGSPRQPFGSSYGRPSPSAAQAVRDAFGE